MPCLSVGEKVPLVTSPITSPAWSSTCMPCRGMPRPSASRPRIRRPGPCAFTSRSASDPQKGSVFFHPTAQDRPASTGLICGVMSLPCSE